MSYAFITHLLSVHLLVFWTTISFESTVRSLSGCQACQISLSR
jgi:hypothetical protein